MPMVAIDATTAPAGIPVAWVFEAFKAGDKPAQRQLPRPGGRIDDSRAGQEKIEMPRGFGMRFPCLGLPPSLKHLTDPCDDPATVRKNRILQHRTVRNRHL